MSRRLGSSNPAVHSQVVLSRHYFRSLELWIREGDVVGQTFEALGLAMALASLGRDETALRLEGAIDATWEELGIAVRPRVVETWRERDLGAASDRLGEARAAALYEAGRALGWEQALELAMGATPRG